MRSVLDRLDWFAYRWRLRIRLVWRSGEELNKRVEVENVLLAVAAGKRPALNPDECRRLAFKLGLRGEDYAHFVEHITTGQDPL
jgi:hypothetical protein